MEVIHRLVDRVLREAPASIASLPGFESYLAGIKEAGDDYERANGQFKGMMRIVIDSTEPIPSCDAIDELTAAMGYWRRARNRGGV
jgi:hypothetical protein